MTRSKVNTETMQRRWSAVMMNNYGVPPVALASGDGVVVTDVDGNAYLDLLGGIAVNVLGHCHRAVIDAVTRQMSTLGHTSNLYAAEPGIALAEALVGLLGCSDESQAETRVFLCNSGTEANEVAFKLSRLTGRTKLVAAQEAFHGRTMGSLALTGQPTKQVPFAPLPGDVTHVPYGDTDALAAAVGGDTAAVFLEPIMGECGVVVPPDGYLAVARDITARHGALLILDEVQTGMGRTGTFFAHQHDGIAPDVVTLAKGLGGGLPIGACLAVGAAARLLTPGLHGSTFGGNPICAAAALAVLRVLATDGLVRRAGVLGKSLRHGIESLGHPLIDQVRGRGLLCGIVLRALAAKDVEIAARAAGFLVNAAAPDVIRLAPPLIIAEQQIDAFVTALPAILDRAGDDAGRLASRGGAARVTPAGDDAGRLASRGGAARVTPAGDARGQA
jgi:acetylornithine/N-succinyldiaminopimelate aminotransferase